MAELIECVEGVFYEDGLDPSSSYSYRVVFPGKMDPTFTRNLLTGTTVISDSSDLVGKSGSLFVRTKDSDTYKSCASWFNSFANKNVGNLVKRYENIVSKIGSHHKGYEILFRPSGTILDESTEWVFYYLSEKGYNKVIPSREWNINYVLSCGGDEKLIQGAPTSFAVFN